MVYYVCYASVYMHMCILYFYIYINSIILNKTLCRPTIHSALGFNSLTEVYFTYHQTPDSCIIQRLLISKCIQLCKHHYNPVLAHFHHSQKIPHSRLCSGPPATTHLLSLSPDLLFWAFHVNRTI